MYPPHLAACAAQGSAPDLYSENFAIVWNILDDIVAGLTTINSDSQATVLAVFE
jgi:hypothetical protein